MDDLDSGVSRAAQFLEIFRRIESHFREVLQKPGSHTFAQLVKDMRNRSLITDDQAFQLSSFSYLRNALSHTPQGDGDVIADPRTSAIEQLAKLEVVVTRPRLVTDILEQRISHLNTTDPVRDFFLLVKQKDFSQAPLIDDGQYVGMITLATVARWVAESQQFDGFDLAGTLIGTVRDGRQQQEDVFIECPPSTTVPEALNRFDIDNNPPARGLVIVERGEIDRVCALVTYEDLPLLLAHAH